MFGNLRFLARRAADNPDCPEIPEIEGYTKAEVVELVSYEYWKMVSHLMGYSDKQHITLNYLGRFSVVNSNLRGYIRRSIRRLRKLAKHPNFKDPNSVQFISHGQLMVRLKVALKQLNTLRHIWVARSEIAKLKKSIKASDNKITT